jgi:proline racemase
VDAVFEHWDWRPPADWLRIGTVDLHTGGEPLRVLVAGLPPLPGRTVLEKLRHFREHYDYIRTGTMWEPRGHADMYGAVLTPSTDADFDVFFLHNQGYSTMCGHAIIALTTLVRLHSTFRPGACRRVRPWWMARLSRCRSATWRRSCTRASGK